MTLEEAKAQGYEVLSGPYSRREERLMLRAKDDLDRDPTIRSKVLLVGLQWYIMRTGMVEVPPETDEPEPARPRRVRIQVQISRSVEALILPEAERRFQGSLSLLVEEAVIEKYAPGNELMQIEFRRCVRETFMRRRKRR